MKIITYRKIFFIIAALLVVGSITVMIVKGFTWGVDFTGGSILEVTYQERPEIGVIKGYVLPRYPDAQIQEAGTSAVIIRTPVIDQVEKDQLLALLSFDAYSATEKRFNTIGPSVGNELRSKSIISVIIVAVMITLFIAFVFRKVSKPISSWVYGTIAITVLVHDVVIPAGFFALLGLQVDTLFVVGLLTILGVSINDTIVVFDRIRENLKTNELKHIHESFTETVGKSIRQTLVRSLMTSVTVLMALAALYIWGPETTRNLSIVMFLGMFFGTYSSIFLASPLLVVWSNWKDKKTA